MSVVLAGPPPDPEPDPEPDPLALARELTAHLQQAAEAWLTERAKES